MHPVEEFLFFRTFSYVQSCNITDALRELIAVISEPSVFIDDCILHDVFVDYYTCIIGFIKKI